MTGRLLWYIPNWAEGGHRGDTVAADPNGIEHLVRQAAAVETTGWDGALIGTGWHRPDAFTVAAALAARTSRFEPLVAVRPGYWSPAHFASAAATLDRLSGGRLLVNTVSGLDHGGEYGDPVTSQPERYRRTLEFLRIVRSLWAGESVTVNGEFFSLDSARLTTLPTRAPGRDHPLLFFGGASEAAEAVAAQEADVQLFWGEPWADIAARIARLRDLENRVDRAHPPLEFGLRITVVARADSEQAWAAARDKTAVLARSSNPESADRDRLAAVGQRRLDILAERGDVLDERLFTAPARFGGGGAASTWLVGSYAEVAESLAAYRALGITHLILSDTPYLEAVADLGRNLMPLLR